MSKPKSPSRPLYVCVLGYGAPRDPAMDGNYDRYLTEVFRRLGPESTYVEDIFLCGGYTNRRDLSEAAAMLQWIEAHRPEWARKCLTLEEPITLEADLEEAAREVPAGSRAFIFCEQSRIWSVRFHARRFFTGIDWRVIGIAFDAASMKPIHRLQQLFVHLPIEILSTKSTTVAAFKARKRMQRIAAARAAFNRAQ